VHDIGQLPVGAREPERELELLAREPGVAVAQPDRDEVRVPLPQAHVADLRRNHGPRSGERRQLDDVRAEHPPAERRHRLQVVAHDRAAREPVEPELRTRGDIVGMGGGCRVPHAAVGGDVEAHGRGIPVERDARDRPVGRGPLD
jgi:hypothetical protein